MIHGGLNIDLKYQSNKLTYNQCCLSTTALNMSGDTVNWQGDFFKNIRASNDQEQWLPGCWQCEKLEKTGAKSFRLSMIEKFGIQRELSGPLRIDLLFDRSCNLACVTCSPVNSSFWAKHLKDNRVPVQIYNDVDNIEKILHVLKNLDLSNVGMIQFCGGETLMGNSYWRAAELIASVVPDPGKIELGFQTNCTQPIDKKWFDLISKFKLVKLMMSIDGVGDRFEYLRWPANWNQVTDNIFNLRETLPSNVMFFVQECTSCLNLFYFDEVKNWVRQNFNTNREGDPVDHNTQMATHSFLAIENITQEYADAIKNSSATHLLGKNWQESPAKINSFIREVEKLDRWRNSDWTKVFPEVAELYRRYL